MTTPDAQSPNLYTDSREDLVALYGDRKNPASDYGARGMNLGGAAIDTSVAVSSVGTDPEQLDLFAPPIEAAAVPESSPAFTVDTRLIKGQAYLCAITPDGSIVYKRGQGSTSSPELYGLVEQEARRILGEH